MLVMQTASHCPAPYMARQGSYSASFNSMSTPHFFSTGPSSPFFPLMIPVTSATPKTLHEGYSLHASEKDGIGLFSPEVSGAVDSPPPPQPLVINNAAEHIAAAQLVL